MREQPLQPLMKFLPCLRGRQRCLVTKSLSTSGGGVITLKTPSPKIQTASNREFSAPPASRRGYMVIAMHIKRSLKGAGQ